MEIKNTVKITDIFKTIKQKYKIIICSISLLVIPGILIYYSSFIEISIMDNYKEVLTTIITASSIIISVIMDFTVNKYFDIKRTRSEYLKKINMSMKNQSTLTQDDTF